MTGTPAAVRAGQAKAFLSGALALNVAVAPDDRRFHWTLLVAILACPAAAAPVANPALAARDRGTASREGSP